MAVDQRLKELGDERAPLVAAKLTGLSALTADEVARFREGWPAISPGRRLDLVRMLAALTEDCFDLDFSAVLIVAMSDGDANIRSTAIQGLWEYDGRDLIGPLAGALRNDPEPGVRAEAARALGRYALLSEYDRLRRADAETVDAALMSCVGDATETAEVRARALEAVGARSEPWVRDLIDDAYASGNHRLRVGAIHAMGRNCDSEWLPTLIDHLSDDDPEIRYEAATACGSIADDEATPHLAELIDDEDAEVRLAAIDALGSIVAVSGSDEARELLEAHAGHADHVVRQAARAALEGVRMMDEPLRPGGWPLYDGTGPAG